MNPYTPVLIALAIAVVTSLVFVGMSVGFGPKRPTPTKRSVYECGVTPVGGTRHRFSVKFYLVAVLFLLFDLEAVFMFPWATTFKSFVQSGEALFVLGEMLVFLGVLLLGWFYCLKRGAFEWE